jgi:hypothetical protein
MMFSVPLYFQVTARTSYAEAGAHLMPAVVGNALGGLFSGALIKKLVDSPLSFCSLTWLTLPQIRALQSPRCLRHPFVVRQLPRPYASMAR